MEQINLKAQNREILGKKVKNIRKNGLIPAVLYGKDFKNLNLALDKVEFEKIFNEAGTSTIVNLMVEGDGEYKVLLHEPDRDPIRAEIVHADLYKVNMKQEIHTEIPLEFIGVSPAVEELEGNLIINKDAIEVTCLPDKLVNHIEVDITALKTFDDIIKIENLNIPEGIEVMADPEEIVVQVTPPRSEEELEAMETQAAEAEKAQIENIEAEAEKERAEKEAAEETDQPKNE